MKQLLHLLGLVDLVWVRDSDSETLLRIIWHDKDGNCYAKRSSECTVQLLPNNKVKEYRGRNACVVSWTKYTKPVKTRLSPWKRSDVTRVAPILQGTEPLA